MNSASKIREMLIDICKDVLDDHDLKSWQLEEWLVNNPKWIELYKYINGNDVEFDMNMQVKDLRAIINRIEEDNMDIIIPILDPVDTCLIHGFRHVRAAGILQNRFEEKTALCLSAPGNGMNMYSQLDYNNMKTITTCKQGLF